MILVNQRLMSCTQILYKSNWKCSTNIRIKLKLILNFKNHCTFLLLQAKHRLTQRYKMASIRNVMICTGVLLLAAHYSIGNPVPRHRRSDERCGQNQASESTCTELWTIDTNSTEDSVTQITNGISVYRQIVTGGPVLSELDQVVCIINNI